MLEKCHIQKKNLRSKIMFLVEKCSSSLIIFMKYTDLAMYVSFNLYL